MRLEVYPNLTGLRGTERTIAHMRRLVEAGKTDPKVVLKAHEIIRGISRNNFFAMGNAIFQFVHDRIAYVRDPIGVEFVKSPAITLQTKTGDCDDQAVLFSALAESVGIKTRFKAVKADAKYPSEFSHVYSQAEIPGRGWVTSDTIVPQAKFGWEVSGLPSRTWGGSSGMSFITVGDAAGLGDATFAAGSVRYDEDAIGSTFGDPFGDADAAPEDAVAPPPDTGGSMWSNEPIMASGDEEISTIVDADEDFWGGSSDTLPGPGFDSRMLPPGVGSLNVLTMGRWKPFKKIAKSVKNIGKNVKKAVAKVQRNTQKAVEKLKENTQKGFERIADKTRDALGLSTDESREKAARTVVSKALSTYWASPGVQYDLELLRRAEDIISEIKQGKVSRFVKGPPPTMQGLPAELGAGPAAEIAKQALMAEPHVAAIKGAMDLVKGLGQAKDQEAAQKALTKYVTNFPEARRQKAENSVRAAYLGAGGMDPLQEKPPGGWVSSFQQRARAGKKKGETGFEYWDLMYLIDRLEAVIAPLDAARQVSSAAYQQHMQTTGAQTIALSANVVQQAVQAGTITADEVRAALAITKKVAEGFALTPEEQALAARIVAGAKGKGIKGWMIAVPAAAATAAATLLL